MKKIISGFVGLFCVITVACANNNCTGATYYDADTDACTACPVGYDYNTTAGKTDITQCQIHCDAGTYVNVYTELEYIESTATGKQSIDTGIIVGNSDLSVSFDAAYAGPTLGSQYGFICVGGLGTVGAGISFGVHNNQWSAILPGTNYNTFGSATRNKVHFDWKIANNQSTVLGYASNTITSERHFGTNKPWRNVNIRLFASDTGGNFILAKLYQMRIKLDNVMVRDMVPVRRNSDGAVGMYDRVTGAFFANSGTETFVAGPDVGALGAQCANVGAGYFAPASTVNYGSVGTRNPCPAGTTTVGYGHGADSASDCGRVLHIGDSVVYMRQNQETTPSLHIQMDNGDLFYVNLSQTNHNMSKLHFWHNGYEYTAYDDSLFYGERDFDTGLQILTN